MVRVQARSVLRSTRHPCDFQVVTFGTHDELAPRGGGGGRGEGGEGRGAECAELKIKERTRRREEGRKERDFVYGFKRLVA